MDAAPLSARQLRALTAGVARELTWGLPSVAGEIRSWRRRASAIPDAYIRHDALAALDRKRGQSDGAALLSILTRARNASYLRLLVAYQVIWDFLDSVNERAAAAGVRNGRQLHLALRDAFELDSPPSDHYCHNPEREDGGYLLALVRASRDRTSQLPSYAHVHELVLREARRAEVLAINHHVDPDKRDAGLQAWAAREFPNTPEASWFELSAAASAGLTIFALLAHAAEPLCDPSELARTYAAYFPWTSAAATMLDSYVDEVEDARNGDHVYVSHYGSLDLATRDICALIAHSLRKAGALDDGEKHTLIAASMIALYLSKESAQAPARREHSKALAASGGSLTRALVPVLRLWRLAHGLRST
ncbi:MAG TPA: DUF2600 family protein [Solirubrobacteraceae bacterium]|jgi:tetraprenyl-beta-curcumene synthase